MALKPRPKAVIFDLYNTLIDISTDESDPAVWQNLARVLRYRGLAAEAEPLREGFQAAVRAAQRSSRERYPEVDLSRIFAELLGRPAEGAAPLGLQVAQLFRALTMRRFGLFPDSLPALARLRPAFKLGIVSDAQRAFLEPEMQLLGLTPHFDVRVVSHDYGFRKPDTRLFRMALAALDLGPAEAIFIGDNPYRDVCGARRAGLRAVLISRPGAAPSDEQGCPPDLTVASLSELADLLGA